MTQGMWYAALLTLTWWQYVTSERRFLCFREHSFSMHLRQQERAPLPLAAPDELAGESAQLQAVVDALTAELARKKLVVQRIAKRVNALRTAVRVYRRCLQKLVRELIMWRDHFNDRTDRNRRAVVRADWLAIG